jgi:hypothetical protein
MSNKYRLTGHMINVKSITIFLDWEDHLGNEIQLETVDQDDLVEQRRKRLSIDLSATHKSTLMGLRDAITEELDTRTR